MIFAVVKITLSALLIVFVSWLSGKDQNWPDYYSLAARFYSCDRFFVYAVSGRCDNSSVCS